MGSEEGVLKTFGFRVFMVTLLVMSDGGGGGG